VSAKARVEAKAPAARQSQAPVPVEAGAPIIYRKIIEDKWKLFNKREVVPRLRLLSLG